MIERASGPRPPPTDWRLATKSQSTMPPVERELASPLMKCECICKGRNSIRLTTCSCSEPREKNRTFLLLFLTKRTLASRATSSPKVEIVQDSWPRTSEFTQGRMWSKKVREGTKKEGVKEVGRRRSACLGGVGACVAGKNWHYPSFHTFWLPRPPPPPPPFHCGRGQVKEADGIH